MMTENQKRHIEIQQEFDATPTRVWQAITDAEHLCSWFSLNAATQAEAGGYISLSWEPAGTEVKNCHILEFDPERRLLMTWRDAPGGEHELPVELIVSGRGDRTMLRLVHSGFLVDESWDEEYEAHQRGWNYELRSLKHYVENFFGCARSYAFRSIDLHSDQIDVWPHVIGKISDYIELDEQPAVEALPQSQAERITHLKNTILLNNIGRDFVVTTNKLENGIIRIALEYVRDAAHLHIWAFSWSLSSKEIEFRAQPLLDGIANQLQASAAYT